MENPLLIPPNYFGSRLFEGLSHRLNLPLDQVNFIVSQIIGLLLALVYPKLYRHDVSNTMRHLAALAPGVILGYFCFGYQVSNLLVLSMLCYIAIITCKPNVVQRIVLFVSMFYLSYLHLIRLKYDYGRYTVDITAPSMIIVQKVSSLAFSIHDGHCRHSDELTHEQRKYAVRRKPSLIEFLSYTFQFHCLMAGPLVYFNDYMNFIEGKDLNRFDDNEDKSQPSPMASMIKKLFTSALFAFLLLTLATKFPPTLLIDEKYLSSTSTTNILIYLIITTTVMRFKYYHAWKFGEAICNASGLGFNGYTSDGNAKWDLCSGVSIIHVEFAKNFREALQGWNTMTQNWLRRVAYERAESYPTLVTYVLSAIWHGFYPGYYITFLTGALVTEAARTVRRCLRPHFQVNKFLSLFYDLLTMLATKMAIAYVVFPFVVYEFEASLILYRRLYFFGHISAVFAIFVLPLIVPPARRSKVAVEDENEKKSN